ncbi:MAG: glycosyltransferase family 1 protein [Sphingobacteriaceae bacterium]|nr:MAG: glycosyltransferase family 1 protein [Sphingobacteriaceae bacterium]
MKIGYDAKRAFLNNTGLGNYSRWLIKAMAGYHPDNNYYLYTPKAKANSRLNFLKDHGNIHIVTPLNNLFTSLWRSKGIVADLKRDGIELFHGLSHEIPLGIKQSGIKSVVTVHDLIFMRFPHQFGRINHWIYTAKIKYACRVADKIIAVSQKTKDDIIELLGIAPKKIEVVYQGCDPSFSVVQTAEQKLAVKQKYNLPDEFILSVGTIEERKNLLLTVKALLLVNDGIPLVVVGKPTPYINKVKAFIANNNLSDRAIFLHDVAFHDLPAIYQQANVFVYVSRYEGFGIPLLEAINCGTPAIAAAGSCLEEAGGPNSLYVNPDDAAGLAANINKVLKDETLRQQMAEKGRQYAAEFAEEKLSLQLMQLYTNTLNHA